MTVKRTVYTTCYLSTNNNHQQTNALRQRGVAMLILVLMNTQTIWLRISENVTLIRTCDSFRESHDVTELHHFP
jgi:hypothetical protein